MAQEQECKYRICNPQFPITVGRITTMFDSSIKPGDNVCAVAVADGEPSTRCIKTNASTATCPVAQGA